MQTLLPASYLNGSTSFGHQRKARAIACGRSRRALVSEMLKEGHVGRLTAAMQRPRKTPFFFSAEAVSRPPAADADLPATRKLHRAAIGAGDGARLELYGVFFPTSNAQRVGRRRVFCAAREQAKNTKPPGGFDEY